MQGMMDPGRLLSSVLVVLLECGGAGAVIDGGGDAGKRDVTAPTVTSTEPADGAADVDFGAPIRVHFSEAIDSRSVGTFTFQVFAGSTAVPGGFDVSGPEAVFTPYGPLAENTLYTVVLTVAVIDIAGNRLANPYVFHFATRLGPFDYSLTTAPGELSVVTGGTAGVEIAAVATVGQRRVVTLSVEGCPAASACTLLPATVFDGSSEGTSSLRVVTTDFTPPGRYPMAVQGLPPSTNPVTLEITVLEPPASGVPRNVWGNRGLALCTEPHVQRSIVATTDGGGGAILAWEDSRRGGDFGPMTVFAQRVDVHGMPMWTLQGMAAAPVDGLNGFPANQLVPVVVADGAGGAIVAWIDDRTGMREAYAQRIDASGRRLWGAEGKALSMPCALSGCNFQDKENVRVAAVASGGAVFAWGNFVGTRVWAQRLDGAGNRLWTLRGIPVVDTLPSIAFRGVAAGPAGEAIVAWRDQQFRIFVQKVEPDGALAWTSSGIDVGAALVALAQMVPDGTGGAYLGWIDVNSSELRVQRIASDGSLPWGSGGVLVSSTTGQITAIDIGADGERGPLIAWNITAPVGNGVFAQHLDAQGSPSWTATGVALDDRGGFAPRIVPDGAGGALAAWDGFPFIHVQRLDGAGQPLWGATGFPTVIPTTGALYGLVLVTTDGRAIVGWNDYSTKVSLPVDIFVQSVADSR
jgi:hypothetical protein